MLSSTVALVPLRAPGAGKTRLATALSPEQRAALAGAMLADVCAALADGLIDEVIVVAAGESAAAAASALGHGVILDPPGSRGLNAALGAAREQVGDVESLLVVTADLPRLAPPDVRRLLDHDAPVAIAPTDDGGTGGLLRRPGSAMPTFYGPSSARRHRFEAQRRHLRVATVPIPGFAVDVDTVADLVSLADGRLGPATAAVIAGFDHLDAGAG